MPVQKTDSGENWTLFKLSYRSLMPARWAWTSSRHEPSKQLGPFFFFEMPRICMHALSFKPWTLFAALMAGLYLSVCSCESWRLDSFIFHNNVCTLFNKDYYQILILSTIFFFTFCFFHIIFAASCNTSY